MVIVQERLPHYRLALFEQIRRQLAGEGIDLAVIHGHAQCQATSPRAESQLPWARVVDNRVFATGRSALVWQPVVKMTADADLVIVEQASRMAANYVLLARQGLGGPRVAFWGHGANLQSTGTPASCASELLKRSVSRRPHWWFAYTEGSARRVEALGFPADRVSVVQNAADTSLIDAATALRDPFRCIFVGSLYAAKRLDIVFEAADLVAAHEPRFELTIVGDGEQRSYVKAQAARRPYVEYAMSLYGKELGAELKASSLMLLPGAAGLGILDGFAAGLPVVAIDADGHGPEIEYLDRDRNGLLVTGAAPEFADAVLRALDPSTNDRLRRGCEQTAHEITLDEMVRRFCIGIQSALRAKAGAGA